MEALSLHCTASSVDDWYNRGLPSTPPQTPPPKEQSKALTEAEESFGSLILNAPKAPTHCPSTGLRPSRDSIDLETPRTKLHSSGRLPSDSHKITSRTAPQEVASTTESCKNNFTSQQSLPAIRGSNHQWHQSDDPGLSQTSKTQDPTNNIHTSPQDELTNGTYKKPKYLARSKTLQQSTSESCSSESARTESTLTKNVTTKRVDSPDVKKYKRKLYVGKMKECPPPKHIDMFWADEILPFLQHNLGHIQDGLPRNLSSAQTSFEPALIMSGYSSRKDQFVDLKPTIWISCGSAQCKRAMQTAVHDLQLTKRFGLGSVEVHRGAPRFAARESHHESVLVDFSGPGSLTYDELQVHLHLGSEVGSNSACGRKLLITTVSGDGSLFRQEQSTIGGIVRVNGTVYAVTTAHTLFEACQAKLETDNGESDSEDSMSGESSEGEGSSTEGKSERQKLLLRPVSPNSMPSVARLNWNIVQDLGPLSFGNKQSSDGRAIQKTQVKGWGDFLLLKIDSRFWAPNTYRPIDMQEMRFVDGIFEDSKLLEGPVNVIIDPLRVLEGHLLPTPAMFMSQEGIFHTRKIQMSMPLARGASGAWVVRGNRLCGIVLAVYDSEPYVHMITAEKFFSDIQKHVIQSDGLHGVQIEMNVHTKEALYHCDPTSLHSTSQTSNTTNRSGTFPPSSLTVHSTNVPIRLSFPELEADVNLEKAYHGPSFMDRVESHLRHHQQSRKSKFILKGTFWAVVYMSSLVSNMTWSLLIISSVHSNLQTLRKLWLVMIVCFPLLSLSLASYRGRHAITWILNHLTKGIYGDWLRLRLKFWRYRTRKHPIFFAELKRFLVIYGLFTSLMLLAAIGLVKGGWTFVTVIIPTVILTTTFSLAMEPLRRSFSLNLYRYSSSRHRWDLLGQEYLEFRYAHLSRQEMREIVQLQHYRDSNRHEEEDDYHERFSSGHLSENYDHERLQTHQSSKVGSRSLRWS